MAGMFFCRGTPSTTHSGSLLPVMEAVPRMRILADSPGRPLTACTLTPASLPCMSMSTLANGWSFSSFSVKMPTEPVDLRMSVCE